MNEGWQPSLRSADDSQLDMLVTFNYVAAGLLIFFSFCFIPHLILFSGVIPEFSFPTDGKSGFPPGMRLFFGSFIVCMMLGFWALGAASLISAKFIKQRTRWGFTVGTAIAQCLWTPLGTALGVFTLIVMYRYSVKARYGKVLDA